MDNASEMLYLCITKSEESFQQICDGIPPELDFSGFKMEKLKVFLFNKERNKKVFDQFSYIINNIRK